MRISRNTDRDDARRIYNRFAEIFVKGQAAYEDRKIVSDALKDLLKDVRDKKILDAGCGAGFESRFLAKKGAKVIGIDISEKMIQIAEENCKGLNAKFLVQDFEKTNFEDNGFDIIISVYSIQYKKNLQKVLKEFYRLLKNNGEVILVVPHPIRKMIKYNEFNYFLTGKQWETKKWPRKKLRYKRFGYYRTLEQYFNSIATSNFKIVKIIEPKPVKPKVVKEELTVHGIKFPETLWYPYTLILKLKK